MLKLEMCCVLFGLLCVWSDINTSIFQLSTNTYVEIILIVIRFILYKNFWWKLFILYFWCWKQNASHQIHILMCLFIGYRAVETRIWKQLETDLQLGSPFSSSSALFKLYTSSLKRLSSEHTLSLRNYVTYLKSEHENTANWWRAFSLSNRLQTLDLRLASNDLEIKYVTTIKTHSSWQPRICQCSRGDHACVILRLLTANRDTMRAFAKLIRK